MKTLLFSFLAVGIAFTLYLALTVGLERQQVVDCLKWKRWIEQGYPIVISDTMRETCARVGVKL